MAIEIIVEDGTGVPNANSYVTVAEAITFAAARGVELSNDPESVAVMLIQAMDYLESKSAEYQGVPTTTTQSLSWPRRYVCLSNYDFPNNAIPKALVTAQCMLVLAVNQGLSLLPNYTASDYVTEEKIGPITTKYADPTAFGFAPTFTGVDALLLPLTEQCGQSGAMFFSRRV